MKEEKPTKDYYISYGDFVLCEAGRLESPRMFATKQEATKFLHSAWGEWSAKTVRRLKK